LKNSRPYATAAICIGILSYWIVIAFHSGQTIFQTQHSNMLLGYGAVNGSLLKQGGYWRIIVSQFIHVNFFHMLGNTVFIFVLGSFIERYFGTACLLAAYFTGGCIGLYAGVFFDLELVNSGASQALCCLSGFLLVYFRKVLHTSKITAAAVVLSVFLQCGLDLYSAAGIKEGHMAGFAAGVIIGLAVFLAAKPGKTAKK
jgi:rhomboid protease GluP